MLPYPTATGPVIKCLPPRYEPTNEPNINSAHRSCCCCCFEDRTEGAHARAKQSTSSNGDLLRQGQGGGRGARRRRGPGLPMDARRPVPQPPVGQRRRLRAHQAGMEGRQPGRHDRLPGDGLTLSGSLYSLSRLHLALVTEPLSTGALQQYEKVLSASKQQSMI
mgnify:CR=1 FL=1